MEMEKELDNWKILILSIAIGITTLGTLGIRAKENIVVTALKGGYEQVQNVGTCGYHWEKK